VAWKNPRSDLTLFDKRVTWSAFHAPLPNV
jgi:hypothetical protein